MESPVLTEARPRLLFLQYETPLGTAALSTATFAALRVHLPQAHVTVAAAGVTAEIYKASPLIDRLIVTPHAVRETGAAVLFAARRLRPLRFDAVITDAGNARTRMGLVALASGAGRRIGYTQHRWMYDARLETDPGLSNIENNLRPLEALGVCAEAVEPQVFFPEAALRVAETLLPRGGTRPRIALVTQTSKGHPNEWFDDRWVALGNLLVDELDAELVFAGGVGDADAIDRIRSEIRGASTSVAGRTSVLELAALLTQCDLTITVDTGALHVARGVATPTVVLGNSAQPKQWWLPWGQELHAVLRKDYVPCALCLRHECATRECMQEITVREVADVAARQLARFSPKQSSRAARAKARLNEAPGAGPVTARRTAVGLASVRQ